MIMKDKIIDYIRELRANESITRVDEASTKQSIILRFLNILGWDIFNIKEVWPEFTIGQKRVDYCLRLKNVNKVFLEVKKIGIELDNHQEQLLEYAFKEGVRLAVLTNGLEWWFYLPTEEGNWLERRFYKFNIMDDNINQISENLVKLLSKYKVEHNENIEYAKSILKEKRKKSLVEANLTRAWNKIISTPDPKLISLINETINELCGYTADKEIISNFIKNNLDHKEPITISNVKPPKKKYVPPFGIQDYTRKKIESFIFKGVAYKARNWKDLIIKVAERIFEENKSSIDKVFSLKGTKRVYYTKDPSEQKEPREIGNSGIYVETNFDANSIVKRTLELMNAFGIDKKELKIECS